MLCVGLLRVTRPVHLGGSVRTNPLGAYLVHRQKLENVCPAHPWARFWLPLDDLDVLLYMCPVGQKRLACVVVEVSDKSNREK